MPHGQPAQVFPPGELVREEIAERGWTQVDLANILARPVKVVNEIINGKRAITPDTAVALAKAFGTSAQLWMNLETSYRLSKAEASSDAIGRRARVFEKAPIGEMIRRGWIPDTRDAGTLERQLVRFFGLRSLDDDLNVPAAARTGLSATTEFRPAQLAWMHRAKHLARLVAAAPFNLDRFKAELGQLKELTSDPEQARVVPSFLSQLGVRFLIIEHLKGTRIDGACLWLDRDTPVAALSMRFDRIDWFWHTLLHELAHIYYEDCLSLDEDLGAAGEDERTDYERRADEFAADFLIPRAQLDDFVLRAGPLYYKHRILGFARVIGVHPGIVVGRLHHRHQQRRDGIEYSQYRRMLEKVRAHIVGSALTDGWGRSPVVELE
jgi:HTH-type transcriptional regulator/antitoxin HigA